MKTPKEWVLEMTAGREDDFAPTEFPEMEDFIRRIQDDAREDLMNQINYLNGYRADECE